MSTSITRSVVLAAAAVVGALTFGLALAHGAVQPALGFNQLAEHWNAAVQPKNGPHPTLPIIPGGPRGRIAPDGIQFGGGKTHVAPDGLQFQGGGGKA